MKRAATKRTVRRRPLPGVDVSQIVESLRLIPTQRWERHRVFIRLVEEFERAEIKLQRDP
jgi:hypothetical protein